MVRALFLVAACGAPPPAPATSDTASSTDPLPTAQPTADTGTRRAPVVVGGCALDGTVATCTFTATPPVPELILEVDAPHLTTPRRYVSVGGASHTLVVPLLTAATDWRWTATAADAEPLGGTFRTGDLPESPFSFTLAGVPVVEQVAFAGRCGEAAHLVVVDAATGRLALGTDLGAAQPQGLRLTDGGDLLVMTHELLREVDVHGAIVAEVPVAHVGTVHHDALRWGDGYALLYTELVEGPGGPRYDDGIVFVDGSGAESTRLPLADVVPPRPWTDGDWSHANSLGPTTEPGVLLVSLRHQSVVFEVVADPSAPDFGALRWWLAGDPTDPELVRPSDFTLIDLDGSPAGFDRQHDPNRLPDGRVTLFDNGHHDRNSRVLDIRVDPASRVAVVEQEWLLDRHCAYQGGARWLPGGGRLATCAPHRRVVAFAPDRPDAEAWTLEAACAGVPGYVTRALPAPW